jgi:hypothetical protein
MAPVTVPNIVDINVSQISFSEVKTMDSGGKMINVYYNKAPFVFKVPAMKAPFGMSNWKMIKYSIDLALSQEQTAIKDKFEEIERHYIQTCVENSVKWLGKKEDPDVVEELFNSAVRYARDKNTGEIIDKYPPTIKFQVPYKNGKFAATAYDSAKKSINISEDTIPKRSMVAAVVHASGIWVIGGKFGCTMKIEQMKVDADKGSFPVDVYAFMEDPEDEPVESPDC